jgi:hypothetical protein
MLTTSLSERWARFQALRISLSSPFRFKDLPPEIALRILALAITTPAKSKTYMSLVRVSREFRVLALEACLPHVPVVLFSLSRFESFRAFLDAHPTSHSIGVVRGGYQSKHRTHARTRDFPNMSSDDPNRMWHQPSAGDHTASIRLLPTSPCRRLFFPCFMV